MESNNWNDIDSDLDSLYLKHSDSILVPFTLYRIGDEAYKILDFEKLYKYSKLMLAYDHKKLKTNFPKSQMTKWDWYCKYLPTSKIYNWGNFYLASAYLERKQYDSCLFHLDSSDIGVYVSLPSEFTYNISAGLQKAVMRSKCLQGLGNIDSARKVLIPYLFLDKLKIGENFYSHKELLKQYFDLLELSSVRDSFDFSLDKIFEIKEITDYSKNRFSSREFSESNDSIVYPNGWRTYKWSDMSGNYIKVEDIYVPIYFNYFEWCRIIDCKTKVENYLLLTEFYTRYKKFEEQKKSISK